MLADYGQIVPARCSTSHGALNLHPSLLPRYRGATPIPAAILAGDAETGVTLMRMDAGLDTGPIVAQDARAACRRRDDAASSRQRSRSRRPSCWAVTSVRGCGASSSRDTTAGATGRRSRGRSDGRTAGSTRPGPAIELERQVRAYQPWPGSFVETPAGRLIVWRAGPDGLDRPAGRGVVRRGRPRGRRRVAARGCSRSSPPGATRMAVGCLPSGSAGDRRQ